MQFVLFIVKGNSGAELARAFALSLGRGKSGACAAASQRVTSGVAGVSRRAIELVLTGAELLNVVIFQFGTKEVRVVITSLALPLAGFWDGLVVRETEIFICRSLAASC